MKKTTWYIKVNRIIVDYSVKESNLSICWKKPSAFWTTDWDAIPFGPWGKRMQISMFLSEMPAKLLVSRSGYYVWLHRSKSRQHLNHHLCYVSLLNKTPKYDQEKHNTKSIKKRKTEKRGRLWSDPYQPWSLFN